MPARIPIGRCSPPIIASARRSAYPRCAGQQSSHKTPKTGRITSQSTTPAACATAAPAKTSTGPVLSIGATADAKFRRSMQTRSSPLGPTNDNITTRRQTAATPVRSVDTIPKLFGEIPKKLAAPIVSAPTVSRFGFVIIDRWEIFGVGGLIEYGRHVPQLVSNSLTCSEDAKAYGLGPTLVHPRKSGFRINISAISCYWS